MTDEQENGFEYKGVFYPWTLTTGGKDLLLIDRITGGMPPREFFQIVEDEYAMERAPVTLALVATSMRHRRPDWSLERIVRTVMDLDMESDDFEVIGGGDAEEEAEDGPPVVAAEGGPSDTSPPTSNGSAAPISETSPETPVSSGSPGSDTGSPDTPVTA